MHRLQQTILSALIHKAALRYADLKPTEVEGNLFTYHLRVLIRQGLVAKTPDGRYNLTPEGRRYADGLSLVTMTPRVQARIVTLIVVQNAAGEFLWLKRGRQPLLGQIGFVYGKLHLGETIAEAASRELHEKSGLRADLTHRGDGYVTIYEGDEPVSQILFHLFYGSRPTGELSHHNVAGEVFWGPEWGIDEHYMASCQDLLRLIRQTPPHERFFCELIYR